MSWTLYHIVKWLQPCYRKYMGYSCGMCTIAPQRLKDEKQCGWPSLNEWARDIGRDAIADLFGLFTVTGLILMSLGAGIIVGSSSFDFWF